MLDTIQGASASIGGTVRHLLKALDKNVLVRDEAVGRWAASLEAGSRVLDVGAGTGKYRSSFSHCTYLAHDLPSADFGPSSSSDLRSDITNIPLPDQSQDALLCTEVLEHVEEPLAAISEFCRLLRPGGKLFLSVPAACRVHRVPTHFWGGFAPDFFSTAMAKRGFQLDELRPVGNWTQFMAQEIGRVPIILRENTDFPMKRWLSYAAWPMCRVLLPSLLLGMSRFDRSDDLPLGWICLATRQ
jgi:SAM-dependent methyltransferase